MTTSPAFQSQDALKPLPPGFSETVACLGTVSNDGETSTRASRDQHLPLRISEFLCFIHDDVGKRPSERVRFWANEPGLIDERVNEVLTSEHRDKPGAVFIAFGFSTEVVNDPLDVFPFGSNRLRVLALPFGQMGISKSAPRCVEQRQIGFCPGRFGWTCQEFDFRIGQGRVATP